MRPAIIAKHVLAEVGKDSLDREVGNVSVADESEQETLVVTRRDKLQVFNLVLGQILKENALPTVQRLRGDDWSCQLGVLGCRIVLLVLE